MDKEGLIKSLLCRDIPGVNNLTAPRKFPQEVFVTDKISHAGQVCGAHGQQCRTFSEVIGVVVANDTETSHAAAKLVKASP